jgi:hypothetical protein
MKRSLYAVVVLATGLFVAGRALSVPQGSQQRACIDALNGSSVKVGKTQAKEVGACVRDGGRGELGPLPLSGQLEACFVADSNNRVFTVSQKGLGREQSRCLVNFLPTFAVPDLGANPYDIGTNNYSSVVNPTALKAQLAITHDLFGYPADGALADAAADPDAATCQYQLVRAALKCSEYKQKTFNKCKKTGLKNATIAGPADLETQCLTTAGNPATGQADPKGRLLSRCENKFATVISKKCLGLDLNSVFPGSCAGSGSTATCLGERVDCRLCQQLNLTDGLGRDCDLFDDGTDNESCANALPSCGDAFLDAPEEQCDDGNTDDGDCCSSTCQHEANGSTCGSGSDDDCTNPDTCDGNGACQANDAASGSACGDPTDNDCTDADTCDGSGSCQANDASAGSTCGDGSNTDCTDPDTCDGAGSCLSNHASGGAACGDPTNDQCTDPDTCDGAGTCEANDATAGTTCGDGSDNDCTDPDTCDGAGTCEDNHATAGATCGDGSDTDCSDPDSCDGGGACISNHETAGTTCTDDGNACTSDTCNAGGTCDHAVLPNGSPCGNGADTDCTNPDTCSSGTCVPNHAGSGAPCTSDGLECTDDLCDGSGSCTHPNKTAGTPCSSDSQECTQDICGGGSACTHPPFTLGTPCTSDGNPCTNDQCNGAGTCSHPHNTAPCNDLLFCNGADTCSGGTCSVHAGPPCPGGDGDNNCAESCNEAADNCLANDPNGTFCSNGQACDGADSCSSGVCVPSGVCCGTQNFTFTVNSNHGGAFDSAEWPGGTASQSNPVPACNVTINRPNNNIDQVCTIAAPFSVNGWNGFQSCFGTGGEDGDGCQADSCPPVGIPSCCSGRPSCSAALNGSGSARYFVQCVDP